MLFFLPLLLFSCIAYSKIEDNSFLIEEAFNQKAGEYQFIQRYQTYREGDKEYDLELEIPVTDETHQLSLAIQRTRSFSDLEANYRWQAYNMGGKILTQRFGLILPTGSVENENSYGVVGYGWLQSATVVFSETLVNHWNLGINLFPNAESSFHRRKKNLTNFTGGTSLIYLYRDNLNFLLEGIIETEELTNEEGRVETEVKFTLNPGMRFAWNYEWKKTQVVPGVAFPISFNDDTTDPGIFLYFSLESTLY